MANPTPRKAVYSVEIDGLEYPLIDAIPIPSTTIENTKIAAFGDKSKTAVPTDLQEYQDMKFSVLDEGDKDPPAKGIVSTFTFITKYSDGTRTGGVVNTTVRSTARLCFVTACEPGSVTVDGERKSIWGITVVPQGGDDPDAVGYGAVKIP